MDLPISITADLIVIGGAASALTEFMRGLILRIDDHPRLARSWKYLPPFLGVLGVLLFPEAAPVSSLLVQLAYGSMSPVLFYAAYPIIKKLLVAKTENLLGGAPAVAELPQAPKKEGEV